MLRYAAYLKDAHRDHHHPNDIIQNVEAIELKI